MLITLLLASATVASYIWARYSRSYYELPCATAGICITLFGCCLILVCAVQIDGSLSYESKLYERAVLEYRLEQGDGIAGNELLYADATSFNKDLRVYKLLANNPWTNWFVSSKLASIDYVSLPGVESEVSHASD